MKIKSSSGIYKNIYHNGNYSLFFRMEKLQRFEMYSEQS